ncbi:hypothetical protein CLOM_g21816 [Closterium sp. NIES-68]|nr:hypothetical protein CLOM_g21816 [Closterium sp. NIES-68]GJP84292.1 hypothetical protein CLOP_g14355 [Closterium sp. NIES-67]
MAARLALLLLAVLACACSTATGAKISQVYVFGDESVDVGNANLFKQAPLKANKAPYGVSYKPASGRFSDGKLVVDYLADFLAIAPPRADLAPRNASLPFTGLDFATAGAGAKSGTNGGKTRGLQVQFNEFRKWFHEAQRTNNPDLKLGEALFVISIGANDYIAELSRAQPNMTTLTALASSVSNIVINITQSLYKLTGSSNIVLFDLPNLGCIPAVRRAQNTGINCTDAGNQVTIIHNFAMITKSDKLRTNPDLPMPNLVFFRQSVVYKTMIQVPVSGLTNQTYPCCEAVTSTGTVVACGQTAGAGKAAVTAGPCAAPAKYLWWDALNPTQAVNQKVANTLFFSSNPNMVRPNGLKKFFGL